MDLIGLIAEAIARMEGFYKPGSLAQRNNNPGNLRSWGSNPIVNGYAQFPTVEAGWAALRRQVELNIGRGLTLEEFFAGKAGVYGGYAPSADKNDPANYARFVSSQTGIPLSIPISQAGRGSSPANSGNPPPLFATSQTRFPLFDVEYSQGNNTLIWAAVAVAAGAAVWMLVGD